MTDREALQQALEALEAIAWSNNTTWQSQRAQIEVDALRERLAQPERVNQCGETCERAKLCATCARALNEQPVQEPVARVNDDGFIVETGLLISPGQLLYTGPPQRTWQGLTDDEIDALYAAHHNQYGECETVGFGYERAIEAKLREKNHG